MTVASTPLQAPYSISMGMQTHALMKRPLIAARFMARTRALSERGLTMEQAQHPFSGKPCLMAWGLLNGRPVGIDSDNAPSNEPILHSVWIDAALCEDQESAPTVARRALEVLGLEDFPAVS